MASVAAQDIDYDSEPNGSRQRPSGDRPLGGYAVLTAAFGGLGAIFAAWHHRSERELPAQVATGDLLLVSVATHKLSRLITKDRVTSAIRAPFTEFQEDAGRGEVEERATGEGLGRAIGELLVCPYCLGLWIAAALTAGLIVAPRATRWIAAVFTALSASDVLQIAYKRLEATL